MVEQSRLTAELNGDVGRQNPCVVQRYADFRHLATRQHPAKVSVYTYG